MTEAKSRHDSLNLVGLRSLATAAGLLQLCRELRGAGVLTDAAIDRIKAAILDELLLQGTRAGNRKEHERNLRARLDALFAGAAHLSDGNSALEKMAEDRE